MQSPSRAAITSNELLAALPARDIATLLPNLELVHLSVGTVLYEPGDLQNWAYFPAADCVAAKQYVTNSGATCAVALIGREGVVGSSLCMGIGRATTLVQVQSAGSAWRIRGDLLRRESDKDGVLRQSMLRHREGLLVQCSQTAVCNRHHTIEQQLCRWLLMLTDRLASDKLHMTQELIARMLGVRREGVTEYAGKLQRAGVIRYCRGRITVLDRAGLQAISCECYEAARDELARLLPWSQAVRGYQPGGGGGRVWGHGARENRRNRLAGREPDQIRVTLRQAFRPCPRRRHPPQLGLHQQRCMMAIPVRDVDPTPCPTTKPEPVMQPACRAIRPRRSTQSSHFRWSGWALPRAA